MIEKPVFKPNIQISVIENEGMVLLTRQEKRILTGLLYERLVPLIDGNNSTEDLVEALSKEFSPSEVYYLLELMESRGYITEKYGLIDSSQGNSATRLETHVPKRSDQLIPDKQNKQEPNSLFKTLFIEHNLIGLLQIKPELQERYHLLLHGATMHGSQSLNPARRREPLSYFHRTGPLGQLFAAVNAKKINTQVAVVGLGIGTIVCYARPGDCFTFYELDPAVERIARSSHFTFLQDCPAKVEVVIGDGRLSLQQASEARYDLIILDAFNSNAVPLHLFTKEALNLYLSRLTDGGVLVFNISCHYLDLKSVLGNLASDAGVTCVCQENNHLTDKETEAGKTPSAWVAMVRRQSDIPALFIGPHWQKLTGDGAARLWTDDLCNIITAQHWNKSS
jgi:hypothetical protein